MNDGVRFVKKKIGNRNWLFANRKPDNVIRKPGILNLTPFTLSLSVYQFFYTRHPLSYTLSIITESKTPLAETIIRMRIGWRE